MSFHGNHVWDPDPPFETDYQICKRCGQTAYNPTAQCEERAPLGRKYWRGIRCQHVEVVEPQESHEVGDSEPCVHCDDVLCLAVVEQGREVCIVVGSSPRGT